MRLGVKFALFLVIPLVSLTALFGYLYQRQNNALLSEELEREGRAIALVVQIAAEDYLRDRQLADLRQLVDRITGYERVLGLRIFDDQGRLQYQSSSLVPYPFAHREELASVLRTQSPAEMRRLIGTRPVVGFIFPLNSAQGRRLGAVQVLQLESFIEQDAKANRDFIIALCLAMAVATVSIVLVVTRFSVTRPIEEQVRRFRKAGAGVLPARVPVRGKDELGILAREFNGMCQRLETAQSSLSREQERRVGAEKRLRSAERLAGLGRLAAGLAHEIGTPLNVISGRADALHRSVAGNEGAERNLRIISSQIERIVRIVRDMLDFARMKPPRRAPTEVAAVVRAVLDLTERRLEERGVQVGVSSSASVTRVTADADQLQQVFLNLVMNAIDAMPEGGHLEISERVELRPHPERGDPARPFLAVCFEDSGTGIDAETQEQVFDPFFTTKDVGVGAGLGLSVSYGIVEEHGGWLDLDSEKGRGTRVTVHLPVDRSIEMAEERAQARGIVS